MNKHIHSLNNHEMNTQIYSLIWTRKRETYAFNQWICSPELLLPSSAGSLGLVAPACVVLLWFTWHLRSARICHTVRSRNNTHSSLQPLTVMLRQAVLWSFQPVTPVLVTTGTAILHPSHCSPRSTSSASHYPALHECTYRRKNWLLPTAQHFRTECFPSPSTCMYTQCCPALSWFTCGSILWYWLGIKLPLNGSSCLWMCHVTSGCLCYLWMHHVDLNLNHVTSECVMLLYFTFSSVTYIYAYIENPLRVSHISTVTVVSSVVSNGFSHTLHLEFCHISLH